MQFFRTLQAVAWSFLGIRRRRDFERDQAQLNPIHLIGVGLLMALGFVVGLWMLVQWVVAGA